MRFQALFDVRVASFFVACLGVGNLAYSQTNQELGPNASEENRKAIAMLIQAAASEELQGKEFEASDSKEIKIDKTIKVDKGPIKFEETIKVKLGDVSATAKASFNDPVSNMKIAIPELKRKDDLIVRGRCTGSCPFKGKIKAEVLGVSVSLSFSAKASLDATADITFVAAANDTVKVTPKFVKWIGTVKNVEFSDEIADAALSDLATKLVNDWLNRNKEKLMQEANEAIQKAADKGKLSADPNDLFK